jgi:hypothetical protein
VSVYLNPPTVVAAAAYTGLRLGELRGLVWGSYVVATDEEFRNVAEFALSLFEMNEADRCQRSASSLTYEC